MDGANLDEMEEVVVKVVDQKEEDVRRKWGDEKEVRWKEIELEKEEEEMIYLISRTTEYSTTYHSTT